MDNITTMESDYYVNFELQFGSADCKKCPLRKVIDEEE
jgi:hypothetical protein